MDFVPQVETHNEGIFSVPEQTEGMFTASNYNSHLTVLPLRTPVKLQFPSFFCPDSDCIVYVVKTLKGIITNERHAVFTQRLFTQRRRED